MIPINVNELTDQELADLKKKIELRDLQDRNFESALASLESACTKSGFASFEAFLNLFLKKRGKTADQPEAKRTRVVLSEKDKEMIKKELGAGTKVKILAEKFGVSVGTVNNLKSEAGLTKKRK